MSESGKILMLPIKAPSPLSSKEDFRLGQPPSLRTGVQVDKPTPPPPVNGQALTEQEANTVLLMGTGVSLKEAAKQANLPEPQVLNLLRNPLAEQLLDEVTNASVVRLRALFQEGVETLSRLMKSQNEEVALAATKVTMEELKALGGLGAKKGKGIGEAMFASMRVRGASGETTEVTLATPTETGE